MKTYSCEDLSAYLRDDWIGRLLMEHHSDEEEKIRTDKWLASMDNKRMIYADVYGDILKNKGNMAVLDTGGGYTSLTKILGRNCRYELLDFLAHGGGDYIKQHPEMGIIWHGVDWYNFEVEHDYDVVIANDIFPDVDQRIELFIDKFLPHCKEMRLVLTYYNMPRFYTTQRIDDTEILTFLSWDGEILGQKLKKYLGNIDATEEDLDAMRSNMMSIYRNGRQVAYARLKGTLC